MRMKLKNLKKLISVAIICTMITTLFVPTLSVQAAETQSLVNVVENYTDIENSEYKITNIRNSNYSMDVYYSVPQNCKMVMAVYDGITEKMTQLETKEISASTDGYTYFYFDGYGNRKFTYKLFIVDFDNRPLGKSHTKDVEITDYYENPSFGYDMEIEPHPTAAVKEDSGRCGYNADWSLSADGVLTIDGDVNPYHPSENAMPWNEYRDGITSVVFTNPPYSLGNYILQGLSKVKEITIPDVSYVEYGFIQDMASLETVYIGSYTDSINGGAFINCPALKNFVVDEASECYKAIDGILYSKDGTALIRYPSGRTDKTFVIPDTVDYIYDYAFEGAKNLETIVMSDNVKGIYSNAFKDCTSLSDITLSANIRELSYGAFSNCSSLKSIELPESLDYIGGICFENTAIEAINIPGQINELEYEGSENFIQSLPDTVKRITVSSDNTYYTVDNGVLFNADKTKLIKYPCVAPETSYTVPESVKVIDCFAFANCKNLESITIGDNVQEIYGNAFENCSRLKSVALANVASISNYTFKNCASLESVDFGNVTEIYEGAFYGCKSLETITIPVGVSYIANNIFAFCDSLKSINVEDGNSNYRTVDDCLYEGDGLKEFPNAKASSYTVSSETTEILSYAFSGRTSLTSITVPDSVSYVRNNAFSDCANLKNVSLPESISEISYNVFYNCTSLPSIVIPDSVAYVDSCAFQNCKSLKSVELPNNDYCYLADRAFSNTGLESITIPRNVELYYIVFVGSHSLKSIKFMGDPYEHSPYLTFWDFDDLTIYYPRGNASWTSSKMFNYEHKDSLKWVAYDDGSPNYKGKYKFTGLEPNCEYIVGITDVAPTDSILIDSNTLYIDMMTADSNGTITMNYALKYGTRYRVPFVLGVPKYDISEASISIPDMVYSGKAQDKPDNYKVTLDGKKLVEGIDYFVTSYSGFDGSGEYRFYIVGMGNYYGSASKEYWTIGTDFDVDGDGIITIRDCTAIQLYLVGLREINDFYAADVNGDEEITIDDVTSLQKFLASIV